MRPLMTLCLSAVIIALLFFSTGIDIFVQPLLPNTAGFRESILASISILAGFSINSLFVCYGKVSDIEKIEVKNRDIQLHLKSYLSFCFATSTRMKFTLLAAAIVILLTIITYYLNLNQVNILAKYIFCSAYYSSLLWFFLLLIEGVKKLIKIFNDDVKRANNSLDNTFNN